MISEKFKIALKLDARPNYKIAWAADVHPVTLSQIATGYIQVKLGDERVIRIGKLLGLQEEECFSKNQKGEGKWRAD